MQPGLREVQREGYSRGAGTDYAQITFQCRVGRKRPRVGDHSGRPNSIDRLLQMTRIGGTDERDRDCRLGKAE